MSVHPGEGDLAEKLTGPVTTLRIILVALASGIVMFAVVAVVVRSTGGFGADEGMNVLSWMALGLAPIALVASRVVPGLLADALRRQIASGKQQPPQTAAGPMAVLNEMGQAGALYGAYQTTTIISAALVEGAAMLSVIAFMLEGAWITLGVALGLAGVILALFPSPARAAAWVSNQLRRIEEERQLGH